MCPLFPCSGPDALKGNHCKHIVRGFSLLVSPSQLKHPLQLFVFLKVCSKLAGFLLTKCCVLGPWRQSSLHLLLPEVRPSSPYPVVGLTFFVSRALLKTELEEIFAKAPAAPNSAADSRIISAYENATGKKVAHRSQPKERRSVDGEDCPVCYETMSGRVNEDLSLIGFSQTCCNGLHKECFQQCTFTSPLILVLRTDCRVKGQRRRL